MYFIYSLLFTIGILVTAPYYLWRLRGNITSISDWKERFGFLPSSFQQAARGAIWVHAVSVGETLAATGLIYELQKQYPGRKIFVSHVTVAGREVGESRMPRVAGRFLLPLDWASCVRRALRRIQPALLVVVETELWPNLVHAARGGGASIIVVNGRISDRSAPRYRRVRFFMRRVLADVDQICAQSEGDAERFRELGAREKRVVVTGNLKFDARPPEAGDFSRALARGLADSGRGPVLIAASTMAGEEKLLVPVIKVIRERHPRALFIFAPRHPARFDEVAAFLAQSFPSLVRRTQLTTEPGSLREQIGSGEILLLDTIGELAGVFELADAVFVGGSFVPTGGHNILEPAYWAKPIAFGPHMHNFRDIAQLFLKNGAAAQVLNPDSLARHWLELLAHPERRRELGDAGRRVLDTHRGSTGRVLEVLESWMESPVAAPRPAEGRT